MKSTFKVLFYLKKGSEKKNGEVMIMARITIDGKLCQFSTCLLYTSSQFSTPTPMRLSR